VAIDRRLATPTARVPLSRRPHDQAWRRPPGSRSVTASKSMVNDSRSRARRNLGSRLQLDYRFDHDEPEGSVRGCGRRPRTLQYAISARPSHPTRSLRRCDERGRPLIYFARRQKAGTPALANGDRDDDPAAHVHLCRARTLTLSARRRPQAADAARRVYVTRMAMVPPTQGWVQARMS